MILQIYSDASYVSEPEARSRAGGYFSLGSKSNTPIQYMPPDNGPMHVESSITIYVMASATEAELGGLFENCQKATSTRTALTNTGHQQPPTENTSASRIVNGTE